MNSLQGKLDNNGRLLIPSNLRKKLGIRAGDDILLCDEDNFIYITTPEHSLNLLKKMVEENMNHKKESLVDQLIIARRLEAKNE